MILGKLQNSQPQVLQGQYQYKAKRFHLLVKFDYVHLMFLQNKCRFSFFGYPWEQVEFLSTPS